LIAKSKVKGPLGRPRRKWVDIIKRILGICGFRAWSVLIWLGTQTVLGSCEHGSEHFDSVKREESVDWISVASYWLLEKDTAP
jgi:hypothetical protein